MPRHLPPQTSLRFALHTLPARRPPQAVAKMAGMRFGNVFRKIGACWLALCSAPRLPRRVRSSHHVPAPVPPPVAIASSVVHVTPGASAFVPHLCSLVVPAGTLDAAPSGGSGSYQFWPKPKQVGSTCSAGNRWGGQRVNSINSPTRYYQPDEATGYGQRINPVASRSNPIEFLKDTPFI